MHPVHWWCQSLSNKVIGRALLYTVFPHIRPAGINFSLGLQLRVLLEITKIHLHKSVPAEGIIRVAGIIRGRALYEEIR